MLCTNHSQALPKTSIPCRSACQVTVRRQAVTPLTVHRHIIATWLRTYRDGRLAAVFERLQERLAPRVRQLSGDPAVAREELGLEVPSNTLRGIVRYQLSSREPGCHAGLMSLGVDCP